jgi:hypothetical protein
VASQAIGKFEVEPTQPFMLRDILPGPGWAPYQASDRGRVGRNNCSSDGEVVPGSCVKGAVLAIVLESVAALTVYGAWHVWHLIR